MTKSEKVPILGFFFPKTILMFRVGFKKNRVGRPTGTTRTFHLSLRYNLTFQLFAFLNAKNGGQMLTSTNTFLYGHF